MISYSWSSSQERHSLFIGSGDVAMEDVRYWIEKKTGMWKDGKQGGSIISRVERNKIALNDHELVHIGDHLVLRRGPMIALHKKYIPSKILLSELNQSLHKRFLQESLSETQKMDLIIHVTALYTKNGSSVHASHLSQNEADFKRPTRPKFSHGWPRRWFRPAVSEDDMTRCYVTQTGEYLVPLDEFKHKFSIENTT